MLIIGKSSHLIISGAILAPATVLLTAKDMIYRFNACDAKCVIAPDYVAKTVDMVRSFFNLFSNTGLQKRV
jgi:acyl-coenzyme A synthetase/AMP-(fatty) acid ligase